MRNKLLLFILLSAFPLSAAQAQDSGDSGPLFRARDLYFAGGFVAGTIAMFPLDRALATFLQDSLRQASSGLQWSSNLIGDFGRTGPFLIGPALWATGKVTGSERLADLGLHGTEALLVAELANRVVKLMAGRSRPFVSEGERPHDFKLLRGIGEANYQSFVSGHSAIAFAAAAAVQQETEEWWPEYKWAIGGVMFGGASLVALSRMYDNRHWASDVVAGALIGSFAGWKVVRWNHTSEPNNWLNEVLLAVSITPGEHGRVARFWLAPLP